MYSDIKKNKYKTGFIITLFIIFIALIMYFMCYAFGYGEYAIYFAVFFSIISSWSAYYYSDKIILSLNSAKPATPEQYKKLNNILESLVISSGLEYTPRLYVVEDSSPNAFATGRNPKNAVVCVTTGLLDKLDYYELEGVIAHELGHIKNYDILLSAVVTVMVGMVVMLSDIFTRTIFYRDNDSDNNKANGIIMILGAICLILSPIFSKMIQLAISRNREYLADATAVQFTRNPDGLISALSKLNNDPNELKSANKATSNMYIVNPFKSKKKDLFSTHPSIESRIEAIKNLK